jgi:glycosyltransferase involved in cell wall biosynthesis
MPPEISVFIPVYNGAAHIADAVGSILAQSFTNWECILIDDASSDASPEYLKGLDDPRFVILRNPVNTHVATASNIAMRLARGRYFARLDQDDMAAPERLRHQAEFLDAQPDIAVCGGWTAYFGTREGVSKLYPDDARIKAMLLPAMGNISNPASMVRMDFIRRHGIVSDPRFPLSCDYGMWVDVMFHGGRFANLQEVVTHYRLHAGQGSRQKEEMRRGVRYMRLQILHAWFPGLTGAQVQALEPILHAYGPPALSSAQVNAGLDACGAALAQPGDSVHGEDRNLVRHYISRQAEGWRGALAAGPTHKG